MVMLTSRDSLRGSAIKYNRRDSPWDQQYCRDLAMKYPTLHNDVLEELSRSHKHRNT